MALSLGPWCNGSTRDFESLCEGSNPSGPVMKTKTAKCTVCGSEYPVERQSLGFDYCISCSDNLTPKKVGYTIYSHKTAGECVIVDAGSEAERLVKAVYKRER